MDAIQHEHAVEYHTINHGDPVGTGTHFAPDRYLLGLVRKLWNERREALIGIDGGGEIIVHGAQGLFSSSIDNLAELCRAPASAFTTRQLIRPGDSRPTESVRDIEELLWECAFHASGGRLSEELTDCDVVQFTHWPNLSRLSVTPNTMRIFALLVNYPTCIAIAQRRLLKITAEEMHQVYSAAHAAGLVRIISSGAREKSGIANQPDETEDGADEMHQQRSFLARLLERVSRL